jgi:hypothetical protein
MEYVVVAFRSRAHTVKFYEFLKKNGLESEIINTPKEAGVGCGLSVKVSQDKFLAVKRAVRFCDYKSFAGFFHAKLVGNRKQVRSI